MKYGGKILRLVMLGAVMLACVTGTAVSGEVVDAKSWPANYFLRLAKPTVRERDNLLKEIAAKLDTLNKGGQGLIVKGAMIDPPRPEVQVYEQLRILDESGLVVVVRRVPNLFYAFPGRVVNRNVYLVAKKLRVNYIDSYITQSLVVEGDFLAYVQKYIDNLQQETLRRLEAGSSPTNQGLQPPEALPNSRQPDRRPGSPPASRR